MLRVALVMVGSLVLFASGCSQPLRAPTNPDGSPMTMLVFVEAGEGAEEARQEAGRDVASNLSGRLADYGWDSKIVSSPEEATLGPGIYLASVEITDFVPGNDEARAAGNIAGRFGGAVGSGGRTAVAAASARLKTQHRVLDEGGRAIASGSAWKTSDRGLDDAVVFCCSETAKNITKDMAERVGK